MNEQFTYLYSVLRHLASAEIPYMLTGSMALAVWAQPRMTRDIDLVIRADGRKVARLVDALQNDNYVSDDAAQEAVRSGTMFNAIDFVTLNKADFILYKDSPYEHEKFERRRRMLLDEQVVEVISAEDLILSKLQWADRGQSSRQLEDVRGMLRLSPGLDHEYLTRWSITLGLTQRLEELVHGK